MALPETFTPSFAFSILDFLPDAIIWVYPVISNGTVVDFEIGYVNASGNKVLNHPKGALLGLYILRDGIPSQQGALANFQHFLDVYNSGEIKEHRFLAHHSGREMETVRRPFEGGVLSATRDRREQREAERKEQTTRRTLESIGESSPNGIVVYDAIRDSNGRILDFSIRHYNERVNELVGLTKEERATMTMRDVLALMKGDHLFERYADVVEKGTTLRLEQYVERTRKWVCNTTVKLDDGVLLTLTDITTIKEYELQLQQTIKALERSNAYLEDFAHAASHDMKEPLRKIRTFIDRLKHSMGTRMNEGEQRLFDRVEASADRMQLMVDDLLEFSYVSESPQEMAAVDLNEKIQKVLADFDLSIEEKQAIVSVDPLPTIKGNKRQLQQLFHNLVGNALKYSKVGEPAEIAIRSRFIKGDEAYINLPSEVANQQFHLIEISDNGIGFEQQFAEKIFQMFQRLHGKAEYAGTGVGLSIARKVVENHNGYIWAISAPGKGSTFHILFPL